MSVEKNNINPWILDKKTLLEELANDIANKFWIEKNKAKELIQKDTLAWIDSLKAELNKEENNNKKLSKKEVEKLFFTLKWALDLIENSSKIEIKVLKEDIEKSINIWDFVNITDKILPKKLVNIAKNPKAPHEHVLGFTLGTANSIIATADVLYRIWKWIIQAPYHIYMIISWSGKSDSFKDV